MPERRGSTHGRPSKLTPEIQAAICKHIELSVPEKYAAAANGIDESTFHEWMKKGAAGAEPYAAFSKAVSQARGWAAVNLTARALGGGPGASQATWLLERRFRDEYGAQLSIGGIAGADPMRFKHEQEAAAAVRQSPEATKKLHEAVALAAADAIASTDEIALKRRRQSRFTDLPSGAYPQFPQWSAK